MIQLFEIKKKIKKEDNELLNKYSEISKKTGEDVLKEYNTSENGITENKATELLEKNGPNVVVKNEKKSRLYFLFNSFKDKFIIILIVLAVINYCLSDALSTYIILGIAVISALIRYFQDYSVYKFNQELKAKMYTTTNVVRGGKEKEIRVEKVVPGDIVHLSAGSMIPADIMLIDSKDLFVNQSVFTGESVPVEKVAQNTNDAKEILKVIAGYTKALDLLDDYDHKTLKKIQGNLDTRKIEYQECISIINKLRFNEESSLFAVERNKGLESIIGNIYQSFGRTRYL